MSINWSKDRMSFDPRLDGRYELKTGDDVKQHQQQSDGSDQNSVRMMHDGEHERSITSAQVKIKSVDRRDSALFTCVASNNFGRAEYNLQVIVQGKHYPPLPPFVHHMTFSHIRDQNRL